ncbi:MAG: TolC family protein, partial [Candidatus Gastranaerophilales bacterium]|nr:TolC family protein [Candidatus Gastranaerophilales bacterium]
MYLKKMVSILFTLLFVLTGFSFNNFAFANELETVHLKEVTKTKKNLNISFLFDGHHLKNSEILETYKIELENFLSPEYNVNYFKNKVLVGDWTTQSVVQKVDYLLNDSKTDVIVSLGFISSNYLISIKNPPKPVVAVFDYGISGKTELAKKSAFKRVSNADVTELPKSDLELLNSQIPFEKLAIFVNEAYLRTQPWLKDSIEKDLSGEKFKVTAVSISPNVNDFSSIIPENVDAIYLTPMYHLSDEQFENLIKAINDKKIPSFSSQGKEAVEKGVLAGVNIPNRNKRLALQAAIKIEQTLSGSENHSIIFPIISSDAELYFNEKTSEAIDFSPKWSVYLKANVVKAGEDKPNYTFSSILKEMQEKNPNILERYYKVRAAKKSKQIAYSEYLPKIYSQIGMSNIDTDRASVSSGLYPEEIGYMSLIVKQNIFSDKLLANISINKKLEELTKQEKRQMELNTGMETAIAYLKYLKLQAMLNIQQNYLENVKINLKLAAARKNMGYTGDEETYRWQSIEALAQNDVFKTKCLLKSQGFLINELIHREQNAPLNLKELQIEDPCLFTSIINISQYLDTPKKLHGFVEMIVARGIKISPELAQVEQAIE